MVYLIVIMEEEQPQQSKRGNKQSEKAYLLRKEIKRRIGEQRVLLPESGGYLVPDEGEQTLKFQQDQLKSLLPLANVHNVSLCFSECYSITLHLVDFRFGTRKWSLSPRLHSQWEVPPARR